MLVNNVIFVHCFLLGSTFEVVHLSPVQIDRFYVMCKRSYTNNETNEMKMFDTKKMFAISFIK